jgi:hypothetical protein
MVLGLGLAHLGVAVAADDAHGVRVRVSAPRSRRGRR